jgi:hypothetical protein
VTPIVLHLRPGAREWFMAWLRETHPELGGRYAALYRGGSYARKEYQARISAQVAELAERYGIGRGRHADPTPRGDAGRGNTSRESTAGATRPAPRGEQLTLL